MLKKYAFYLAASAVITLSGHTITNALAQTASGTVLETINAAGYTYIYVDSGSSKDWVAIPETKVSVGDKVNYTQGMEMKDFHSKSLDRTFPAIIFSPGLDGEKVAAATPAAPSTDDDSFAAAVAREQQVQPATPAAMAVASGGSTGAVVPATEVSVEKAPGDNSYTVEEIFTQAEKLNGQKIRLRGKVVKFNANIMGKNWVHLQDGSGNPMNNTHDLVVTTSQTVAMDDVVIFEGTVAANKDFGAGYNYAVLVEEAQIIK
ncbi:hypothetical protein [Desulfopila aestuarii]|uniref:tRNA_anti-like n=1 Tax=Desulfopila aestuarii DSM 18488 TaxID=1121416 RepID=A0A1M7Y7S3_9BACT|nr:hypothetical protein [Desulfopila aestuarii]SHO48606.1 hypothetical protein SAMN02745220_02396 [Desulfopila aestuarii DSM 18488]